jgi:tRNA (mo5U34)-methyltransferase
MTYSQEQLRDRIASLGPWFHNMEIGGVKTAPRHFLGDYPAVKWNRFADALPRNLAGKTVLDIGCNAGFYSLEMKRRGADRVLGIDFDPDYLAQARFAAEVAGLDIAFEQLSVYDVGRLRERFDVVLFLGVLYHLRHPLLALDLIRETVTKDLLVFQSMQRGSPDVQPVAEDYAFQDTTPFEQRVYPVMHFVERRYSGDPTNWWIPDRACVEAMLRSSGFDILSRPEEEVYICRAASPPAGGGAVYPVRGAEA